MSERIIHLYKNTDDAELELRFSNINADSAKKLVNVSGIKTLEQSVNTIKIDTKTNSNDIRTIYFNDGVQVPNSAKYINKKSISRLKVAGTMPYTLSLAKEVEVPKVSEATFARVKLRLSVRPTEYKEWRIDITLANRVDDIQRDIKTVKNKMLYAIDIPEFNATAPWGISTIELEVEHIGDKDSLTAKSIDDIVGFISSLTADGQNYQATLYSIAKHIDPRQAEEYKKHKGMRELSNQVIELNRHTYFNQVLPNITNYYVLDKADGIRTIVRINGNTMYAINSEIKTIPLSASHGEIICDTEYIDHGGKKLYYVFDVMVYDGKNLVNLPSSERLPYIQRIIPLSEGHIVSKTILPLTENYTRELMGIWKDAQAHGRYHIDGLILTPKDGYYKTMKSWKWKPIEVMSIDFLVKIPPENIIGNPPYVEKKNHKLLFLFVGIDKVRYDNYKLIMAPGYNNMFPGQKMIKYFPIQFSPSSEPYAYIYNHPNDSKITLNDINDNVCEFRWLPAFHRWDLMRVRADRKVDVERGNYFGNAFHVAEYTWENYNNPLTFDDLISTGADMGYFQEEKTTIYKAGTILNTFVKSKLLSEYKGVNWLVDLAAGHGQDLFRISNERIKNALFIDSDVQALSDLITRKQNPKKGTPPLNTRIMTKHANLKDDYKQIMSSLTNIIPADGVDVVMCNFAIHYFMDTPAHARNVVYLIKELLKPGGHFFMTAFSGEAIFNLLKGGSWVAREGEVLKYSINKDYTSNVLEPTGQQINLILPFSAGKHYTEYLVNFDYLLGEFKINGFDVVRTGSFSEYIPELKSDRKLTADDEKFVSLYSYAVVRKKDKEPEIIETKRKIKTAEKKDGKKAEKKAQRPKSSPAEKKGGKKAEKKAEKKVSRTKNSPAEKDNSEYILCQTRIQSAKLNENPLVPLINAISNQYTDKKAYSDTLIRELKTRRGPVVTINDIKTLKYQQQAKTMKFGWHNGQRKLFLTELQFLTNVDKKTRYCIYAGASPGNKTHYLSTLFPNIKLILVDPNEFSLILPDKQSHRIVAHDDIVHLKNGYPASTFRANSIDSKDYYADIINTNYKIYIIEDYMTSYIAHNLKQLGADVVFISDIRSNIDLNNPTDFDVAWNNAMNYNWIIILRPSLSMLKYRPPYFNDKNPPSDAPHIMSAFDEAKENGIDFLQNYKDRKDYLPASYIYVQAWQPITSTEVRLWITRENLNNIVFYDSKAIESQFFYYNNIERAWVYHYNKYADRKLNFCNCNDCALESKIWEDYFVGAGHTDLKRKIHNAVFNLGRITFRRLSDKHIYSYFGNITLKQMEDRISLYYKELPGQMKKNTRKKGIHKGDAGAVQ